MVISKRVKRAKKIKLPVEEVLISGDREKYDVLTVPKRKKLRKKSSKKKEVPIIPEIKFKEIPRAKGESEWEKELKREIDIDLGGKKKIKVDDEDFIPSAELKRLQEKLKIKQLKKMLKGD
jgi:hypothetical protein